MTTDQLLAACADAGARVSITQLTRWVREGLIPGNLRRRHSRGRGRGIEWLWDPECLPRAIVIARTLARGDPSLKAAAVVLAGVGYAPAAERLREALVGGLGEVERSFQRRQAYLKEPHQVAAKKHRAALRRKTHDLPPSFVEGLATLGLVAHGLDGEGGAGQYLSFGALRRALEDVENNALLAAYKDAGQLLGEILPWLLPLMNLTQILAAGRRAGGRAEKLYNVRAILEDIRIEHGRAVVPEDSPAGMLRLAFAVLLVALRVHGDAMVEALEGPLFAFWRGFVAYAKMSGHPGSSELMARLERAVPLPKQEETKPGS